VNDVAEDAGPRPKARSALIASITTHIIEDALCTNLKLLRLSQIIEQKRYAASKTIGRDNLPAGKKVLRVKLHGSSPIRCQQGYGTVLAYRQRQQVAAESADLEPRRICNYGAA